MAYFTSNTQLDLYSRPIQKLITIDSITEQCLKSIEDPSNHIPLSTLTPLSYSKVLTEKIPTKLIGIYTISRIDPMDSDWIYGYTGSSNYCMNSRIVKLPRYTFGHCVKTDRIYQYTKQFVDKFGNNLDNTFVHVFPIGYNKKINIQNKLSIDENLRIIENNIIGELKRKYHFVIANKSKAVCSMLSEQKRRSRSQKIEHTLYDV